MTTSEITFGIPYQEKLPHQKIFSDFEPQIAGKPLGNKGELRLFVVEDVVQKMWGHVLEDPEFECAGVLAGQAFFDPEAEITFSVAVDVVRNKSADRGGGYVHISAESARLVREQIEQMNMRPVGWYHSHPTQGIFLSGDDMRIVKGIYNANWQVALVFDPLKKEAQLESRGFTG